ncbi:gamma-secretase subunit Aph-1b-like isoform X1 [Columba livia]|uniref:gamma-secretase subunit Aph-1b-like isoform X1 n=1 Tax=Columba livia TaxID=8932 RepID=UPI0031BAAC06
MTLPIFFGCNFIAFGPALGLFLFTIARDPLRIIILIAGAFFWLASLLFSSLIWFIAVKASDLWDEPFQKGLLIFGVMFSVLLQEAFRFLYYKLLRSTERCQPSAGILRLHGMFLSPATPAFPSILVARAALAFSAISFLLDWWTLASPGGAGAGVLLQQSAEQCGWGWLALPPL